MDISVIKIVSDTIVDGPGLRTSIYFAGCSHHCPGCHNPESWNISAGTYRDINDLAKEVISLGNKKITLSGGDPLYQAPALLEFLRVLYDLEPEIDIWIYTGYTYESLMQSDKAEMYEDILSYCKTIVDGPFIESLKDLNLEFRGSSNQRIINLTEIYE